MTVDVTYAGIIFTVDGYYTPYKPATMYQKNGDPGDPAEGGTFEDYRIFIEENDVTDLLSDDIVQYIMELADEAADDEGEPEPELWKDLDKIHRM
jgi:hypothetical protein